MAEHVPTITTPQPSRRRALALGAGALAATGLAGAAEVEAASLPLEGPPRRRADRSLRPAHRPQARVQRRPQTRTTGNGRFPHADPGRAALQLRRTASSRSCTGLAHEATASGTGISHPGPHGRAGNADDPEQPPAQRPSQLPAAKIGPSAYLYSRARAAYCRAQLREGAAMAVDDVARFAALDLRAVDVSPRPSRLVSTHER